MKKCPAIMITASHNPYEYNGLKLFSNGIELSAQQEAQIEKGINDTNNLKTLSTDWKKCGQKYDVHNDAINEHIRLISKKIDVSLIKQQKPNVIVDCANMAGSAISALALQKCGCLVQKSNCDAGQISPRPLEPNEKNLKNLCEMTVDTNADFAIAHDGDADRAIVVADDGKLLGLDTQLAIAVMHILDKNPDAKIVSTVESSLSLREIIDSYGADLQITPVGSAKVAALMRKNGALFGGEPCGEYVFANAVPSPDGIMSGAFFAQIFSSGQKLSSLAKKVKTYPIMRHKIACKNELKKTAMKKIEAKWPFGTPNKIDGLRSDEAWGWVLVRPSGTEPYVRITMEAKNDAQLKKNFSIIEEIVKNTYLVSG